MWLIPATRWSTSSAGMPRSRGELGGGVLHRVAEPDGPDGLASATAQHSIAIGLT